jgi:hypothetical protein
MLLIISAAFKFTYPQNNLLYGKEFKDADGNFYLSNVDSYYFYHEITDGHTTEALSNIGYIWSRIINLYWLAPCIGILSVLLFFLVSRTFLRSDNYAFFSSLIFMVHPFIFYLTSKGYLDREILLIPIIILFIFAIHRHSYWLLMIGVLLSFIVWPRGWYIFLFILFTVSGAIYYHNKSYRDFWICMMIISGGIIGFIVYMLNYNIQIISELSNYYFTIRADFIIFLVVCIYFVIHLKRFLKGNDTIEATIVCLALIYSLLGMWMVRFWFIAVIFLILSVSMAISRLRSEWVKGFCFGFLLLFLLGYNYNSPTIIMQDAIIDSTINETGCIYGSWDYGHLYQAYSKGQTQFKGTPQGSDFFIQIILTNESEAAKMIHNCSLLINTEDMKKFDVYKYYFNISTKTSGIPIYLINQSSIFNITRYQGVNFAINKYRLMQ